MGINTSIIQCTQQSKLYNLYILSDDGSRASFQICVLDKGNAMGKVKLALHTIIANLQGYGIYL